MKKTKRILSVVLVFLMCLMSTGVLSNFSAKAADPIEHWGLLEIHGKAIIGATLKVTYEKNPEEPKAPDAPTRYQWLKSDKGSEDNYTEISGATSSTYTVQEDDADRYIRVRAYYENGVDEYEYITSWNCKQINLPTTKIIDCGETDWTYYFEAGESRYTSDIPNDPQGVYGVLRFYNNNPNVDSISFNPSLLGFPVFYDDMSVLLDHSEVDYIIGVMGQPDDNGVKVEYNAATGVVTVTTAPHEYPEHIWEYSATDNKLDAKCQVEGCTENASLTINAQSKDYDGKAYEGASIVGVDEWSAVIEEVPEIVYYKDASFTTKTSSADGASAEGKAPSNAGTYYATISAGVGENSAIAYKEFNITSKDDPSNPDKPNKPNSQGSSNVGLASGQAKAARTGDNTGFVMWILVAIMALGAVVIRGYKKEEKC